MSLTTPQLFPEVADGVTCNGYVSRPTQRLLTLRSACSPSRQCDLLHRRLQQLRCLRHCFDCYRVERTSSRAGLTPAVASVGASLVQPCFRFHTPLIEPDVRICRIRLSEKTHAIVDQRMIVPTATLSREVSLFVDLPLIAT
jgi:hypothetical protein